MAVFPRIVTHGRPDVAADAVDAAFAEGVEASERIGAPLPTRRRGVVRRTCVLLALIGGGWQTYQDPAVWSRAWSQVSPLLTAIRDAAMREEPGLSRSAKGQGDPNSSLAVAAPFPEPTDRAPALPAAVPAKEPAVATDKPIDAPPPRSVGSVAPAASPSAASPASSKESYAPPRDVRAGDAVERRAEAAGLHPDLSRAVLGRLSEADYRAAATAIRKALAEADDDAVLIWPPKPKSEAAQFRVSFVEGANTDCRRYVVAIAKDGWQTTALPMEKCGVKRVSAVKKG